MTLRVVEKFIDTDAIAANYQRLKRICAPARVLAVVKCNAYGHGIIKTARSLSSADGFAVTTIAEAMALRDANIDDKILVMQGWHDANDLHIAVKHGIDLVVYSPEQLACLEQHSTVCSLRLWVKFDTGMNRLGFPLCDAPDVMRRLSRLNDLAYPPVLMSHFACADEEAAAMNQKQLDLFEALRSEYSSQASLANSAACLNLPQSRYQWVRAGIALYGALPESASRYDEEFMPAMHVFAPVLTVRRCRKGDSIGYGAKYICSADMQVGIIAIGYGNGYPRHANNETPVWVCGSRQRLLGRVSMDMIVVSLDNIDVQTGDTVELWGSHVPVREVAVHCDTISYELLTAVGNLPEADGLLVE